MNEAEMFERSMILWGLKRQILMLAEEAGELSVASLHMARESKDKAEAWENFAEEIADVEFMVAEMKKYFPTLTDKVDLYRKMKAERLEKRLNELLLGKVGKDNTVFPLKMGRK